MKNLFPIAAITIAFLTTSAKAETINCTEITSVPVVITVQGNYCLKSDKSSSQASGNIIEIQANNVTIDLNGFKLGGLGAGTATAAIGIFASDRQNITVRNGSIRGFFDGIFLSGLFATGYLIEDVLFDTNRQVGINVQGNGHVIRNNRVVNTGPGDVGNDVALAIQVRGRNIVVADNIISGTSEATLAEGIGVVGATLAEVRNNTILDAKDATNKFGVDISGSTNVTVTGNRILNATGTGSQGIRVSSSSSINCIGNTVAGFATALVSNPISAAACNFVSGNILP